MSKKRFGLLMDTCLNSVGIFGGLVAAGLAYTGINKGIKHIRFKKDEVEIDDESDADDEFDEEDEE